MDTVTTEESAKHGKSTKPNSEDAMNFSKYVYVSPQQYVRAFDEWRYEYVVDGKWCQTASFKYRQGKDVFKKIELAAWRNNKSVRKLNQFEKRKMYLKLYC
jgi:hypothetical protein